MRRCVACQHTSEPEERYCTRCGALLPAGGWARALAPEGRDGRWLVGREPGCDVELESPLVSARHLLLELRGGAWAATDQGSTNGTFADGRRLPPHQPVPLGDWTALALGSLALTGAAIQHGQRRRAVEGGAGQTLVVGRDAGCEVRGDSPTLDGRHALLRQEGEAWWICDLGSTSGTFVNGVGIRGWTRLGPGDRVELGGLRLAPERVGGRVSMRRLDFGRELRLDAVGLCVEAPDGTPLLREVSLSAQPGELVLLLGPSGAGKSTLLHALAGQVPPSAGEVLVNGQPLRASAGFFAPLVGLVPQRDVLPPGLSAREVLEFAARLRLPPDAVAPRVEEVLDALGLRGCAGVPVPRAGERGGLSGGQLRRLNLGVELVTDPAALLLDEPCSGLDSRAALHIARLCRAWADRGRPVLMTAHQPRPEILDLADLQIVLCRGRVVWAGPGGAPMRAFFHVHRSVSPHPQATEADLALDALERASADDAEATRWAERFARSQTHTDFVQARLPPEAPPAGPLGSAPRPPVLQQYTALTQRAARTLGRAPRDLALLVAQAPVLLLFVLILFGEQRFLWLELPGLVLAARDQVSPALFLMAASALWLGCNNAARELVRERALFRRERRQGLSVLAVLASRFNLLALVTAAQAGVLALGAWAIGVPQAPAVWAVLALTGLCGVSLGLLASAWARSEFAAQLMVPLLVLPQLMFGGLIEPYGALPPLAQRLADHLVPLRSAFDALALLVLPQHAGGLDRLVFLGLLPDATTAVDWTRRLPWLGAWVLLPLLGAGWRLRGVR